MLFMCQGKARPGLSVEDQQKVLQLFASWKPPAGIEIKAHYLGAAGGDYVIVETSSVEALIEATSIWAPFVVYEVTPIVEAQLGVAGVTRADELRRSLL
jgi:hypothetical protein